jgi:hypothetical protein
MTQVWVMSDAYENALRTVADAYEAEVAAHGGRSLSRVATIVVSSGTFFNRLRNGKPFLVHNLERLAAWFRQPENWPNGLIPGPASDALISIGRPPESSIMTHPCPKPASHVASNARSVFDRKHA